MSWMHGSGGNVKYLDGKYFEVIGILVYSIAFWLLFRFL